MAGGVEGSRPIPSTNGEYVATPDGQVWRANPSKFHPHLDDRPQKPRANSRNGYIYVSVSGKSKRAHVLVAEAFLGPRPPEMFVNHIDGNKTNNCIENLEYVTHEENVRHACRLGLVEGRKGAACNLTKLTEDQVLEIISLEGTGSHSSIAKKFGVTRKCIAKIYNGTNWGHLTGRRGPSASEE